MVIDRIELKDLRELLEVTQAELAAAIGVHPKTIVNWESEGVPVRSEYKVRRRFNPELSYLRERSSGKAEGLSLQEWKDLLLARSIEAIDQEEPVEEFEARPFQEALDEVALASAVERSRLLKGFSSRQLLQELLLREDRKGIVAQNERLTNYQRRNVSGMSEGVDPHEIDLSQGDVELAATKDNTTVTDQIQPDYEGESQAPEEDQ